MSDQNPVRERLMDKISALVSELAVWAEGGASGGQDVVG